MYLPPPSFSCQNMVAFLSILLSIVYKIRNSICKSLQICKNLLSRKTQMSKSYLQSCHWVAIQCWICRRTCCLPYACHATSLYHCKSMWVVSCKWRLVASESLNRPLNVFDTKTVDNWCNTIHECTCEQFDFVQIDISNQTHLVIWCVWYENCRQLVELYSKDKTNSTSNMPFSVHFVHELSNISATFIYCYC